MVGLDPRQAPDVVLVHGVFGSGKSFFLAVLILFLVQIFGESDQAGGISVSPLTSSCLTNYHPASLLTGKAESSRWRILVSSTTNVAVDRILQVRERGPVVLTQSGAAGLAVHGRCAGGQCAEDSQARSAVQHSWRCPQ